MFCTECIQRCFKGYQLKMGWHAFLKSFSLAVFLKFQIFATKNGVTLAVIATSQVPHALLG